MHLWAWVLIFLGAAILFGVLEMFVPSGGIMAFLSAMAILCSIVTAFQSSPIFGGVYLFVLLIGTPILFLYMLKFWPQTFVGRKVLLHPEDDPALQPNAELSARKQLLGKHGIAQSKMMLSGQIEVEGKRINAVSESEALEPGDAVVVVKADGINIIVRKTRAEQTSDEKKQPKIQTEPTVVDPFA